MSDIRDQLKVLGATTIEDKENVELLAEVLEQLPEQLSSFLVERVWFNIFPAEGWFLPLPLPSQSQLPTGLISLNFITARSKEWKKTVIAHELAHAWVGLFPPYPKCSENTERRADDLCEAWGFGRVLPEDDPYLPIDPHDRVTKDYASVLTFHFRMKLVLIALRRILLLLTGNKSQLVEEFLREKEGRR